jgi:hypothetical protein
VCFRAQYEAADALSPPRAQFHDSMTSALNAASAILVIGRCSLPLHALLRPDHPALLGTMLSRPSLGRCSLQRKRFSSDGRLQLRCSMFRFIRAQHHRHSSERAVSKKLFLAPQSFSVCCSQAATRFKP